MCSWLTQLTYSWLWRNMSSISQFSAVLSQFPAVLSQFSSSIPSQFLTVLSHFTAIPSQFSAVLFQFSAIPSQFTAVLFQFSSVLSQFTAVLSQFSAVLSQFTAFQSQFSAVLSQFSAHLSLQLFYHSWQLSYLFNLVDIFSAFSIKITEKNCLYLHHFPLCESNWLHHQIANNTHLLYEVMQESLPNFWPLLVTHFFQNNPQFIL